MLVETWSALKWGEVAKSRNPGGLRTADVARLSGYSVQQIRNLERDGVLPIAHRTTSGYRSYGEAQVHAARAYRELAAGTGPVEAKRIMRAVHTRPLPEVLAAMDAAHARLDGERRELALAKAAVHAISAETIADVRAADAMSISELADALGIRTSTLRHWDAMELVTPDRGATRQARNYTPGQVREARIVHQLRLAGYGITALRALMPELRATRDKGSALAALDARDAGLAARSLALLAAGGALAALLSAAADPPR